MTIRKTKKTVNSFFSFLDNNTAPWDHVDRYVRVLRIERQREGGKGQYLIVHEKRRKRDIREKDTFRRDDEALGRKRGLVTTIFTRGTLIGGRRFRWRDGASAKVLRELACIREWSRTEQTDHIIARQDFFGQQLLRHKADFLLLLRQQFRASLICLVDNTADLEIDVSCRFLGKRFVELLLIFLEMQGSDGLGHAEFGDHGAGHAGYFVEVVGCAASDGVEVEFFADATTEGHGHAVHELVDGHQVVFTGREVLCVTESALSSRDDGDFEERVGPFQVPAADGVAGFVVGYCAFLLGRQDERLLLQTSNNTFDGLFEVLHLDTFGLFTGG
jgi:hypothetical protein